MIVVAVSMSMKQNMYEFGLARIQLGLAFTTVLLCCPLIVTSDSKRFVLSPGLPVTEMQIFQSNSFVEHGGIV